MEYVLILESIKDGAFDEVARTFARLSKKDLELVKRYLDKLPLTLGKKFTREKALIIKSNFEDAGGIIITSPAFPAEKNTNKEIEEPKPLDIPSSIENSFFCPNCGQPDVIGDECPKCGVFISKYVTALEKKNAENAGEKAKALWDEAYNFITMPVMLKRR